MFSIWFWGCFGMQRKPEKVFFFFFFFPLYAFFLPLFSLGTEKDRKYLKCENAYNSCFRCSGNFICMKLFLVFSLCIFSFK